jgi:hypothetical protein
MGRMTESAIVVCGWCRTVQSPAPCEQELASVNVELLARRDNPRVTHTICPVCARSLLEAVADRRAA